MKATYTYLADGTKIKAVNAYNGGSDYVGSFKYNRNGSNISLESVATAGGRTYKTSGGYEARYFVTDHLGSTRLIAYPNGNVIEQNDYMPYGERHANSSLATSGNPFLYNGKESQKSFGVNYIDSEARFQRLDGAFNSMDPLCEKYYHISPYTYCAANPINLIDPNGKQIFISFINGTLKIHYVGKLYNDSKSNYTQTQMEQFATQFKKDIESVWSGTFGDINIETSVDLTVANTMDDINEQDHVIYIGEDYEMDKYDKIGEESTTNKQTANGKGSIGGKYIAINNILLNNSVGTAMDNGRTIAHEFGHNLGLKHPNTSNAQDPKYENNIMWQHNHPLAGKNILTPQLQMIINNSKNNKLNLHSNRYPKFQKP